MDRTRFTEEQIVAVLNEPRLATLRGGTVCLKRQFRTGGPRMAFGVCKAKRLRAIEDKNAKLKRLLAEAMLDNADLKDLLSKNL